MERIPVDSSMIESIGWNAEEGLEVEFKANKKGITSVYSYKTVPVEVYDAIIDPDNDSIGKTFFKLVKNVGSRVYPYTRVDYEEQSILDEDMK